MRKIKDLYQPQFKPINYVIYIPIERLWMPRKCKVGVVMKYIVLINLFFSFNSMAIDLTRPYSPSVSNAAYRSFSDINDKLRNQKEESDDEYRRKQKEGSSISSSLNKPHNNEDDLPICFETTSISNFSYDVIRTKSVSKKIKSEPTTKDNYHPSIDAQIYYFQVPEEKLPHFNWPHTAYDFINCKIKGDFKRFSYFPSKWIYEGISTCDLVFYKPRTSEEIRIDNCKAVEACPATKKYRNMDQVIAARILCNEKPSKPSAINDVSRGATKPREVINNSSSDSKSTAGK